MTDRRRFLGGLALSVLAAPLVAKAQQAAKVSRIGYLSSHSPETFRIEAFRQGLHEFGWVEGRNLIIEYRSADGKFDRIPVLAAELVRLKVDVIVAVPTVSALAAKRVTQTIPIVFTHVSDPIGSGLVPTLARPGGNVTGFTHVNVGLTCPSPKPHPARLTNGRWPRDTPRTRGEGRQGIGGGVARRSGSIRTQRQEVGLKVGGQ